MNRCVTNIFRFWLTISEYSNVKRSVSNQYFLFLFAQILDFLINDWLNSTKIFMFREFTIAFAILFYQDFASDVLLFSIYPAKLSPTFRFLLRLLTLKHQGWDCDGNICLNTSGEIPRNRNHDKWWNPKFADGYWQISQEWFLEKLEPVDARHLRKNVDNIVFHPHKTFSSPSKFDKYRVMLSCSNPWNRVRQ